MAIDTYPAPAGQLTPHVRLNRVEAVVNAASGSVGAGASEALEAIVRGFGLEVNVAEVQPSHIAEAVKAAVEAKPDLVIVLAGDGTARLAAELCGPDGPLVATLPGGTMNMLPRALYGERSWQEALTATLAKGEERCVSGGEVGGRSFYVAAILGSPALWADAREAVRDLKPVLAVQRARRAFMRAFTGPLRFQLDDGPRREAEALTLMCPLVSKALTDEQALEAAALDPHNMGEAFRLGMRAAFGAVLGDWRDDPAVTVDLCHAGRAWARGRIPAILDGEPQRLLTIANFRFKPRAFRALAPPADPPPEPPSEVLKDSVKAAVSG
jgi:diacylglycerol kinase family enzyme